MIYPADSVFHKVPDGLSDAATCYTELLANSIHGDERAIIRFQDVVAVSGAGSVGMGMLRTARLKTPRKLILINPGKAKRRLAMKPRAVQGFRPDDSKLVEAVGDLTVGRGVDVYLEASRRTEAFTLVLELVRKRGILVAFGVYKAPVSVDLNVFGEFKELNILGGHLAPFKYVTALDLMVRGLIDSDICVTH